MEDIVLPSLENLPTSWSKSTPTYYFPGFGGYKLSKFCLLLCVHVILDHICKLSLFWFDFVISLWKFLIMSL